jgi:predicted MFS family arabinose efflux permease
MGAPGIVLPDVASDLGVAQEVTSWVLAAFALGIALANAVGGRWLDIVGARRVVRVGAAITLAGVATVALTPTFGPLVVAELLLGLGTGLVCLTAFHSVRHIAEAERARASGIITAVSFSCIASGPFAGAVMSAIGGWRAALGLCVLTLAGALAMVRGLPPDETAGGRIDWRGIALATAGATALAALLQSPATGTPPLTALGLAALVAAFATLLVRHVRRHPAGFLPATVLRSRELVRLSITGGAVQAGYNALLFAGPVLIARGSGWSDLTIGAALLPAALAATASANAVGTLSAGRASPPLFAALAVLGAAGVALAGLGGSTPLATIAGAMLAVAAYAGVQTLALDRIPRLVPADAAGTGLGTFMYVFITGGAIGSAAVGGLAALTGLSAALALVAVLPLGGAALARAGRRRAPRSAAAEGPA